MGLLRRCRCRGRKKVRWPRGSTTESRKWKFRTSRTTSWGSSQLKLSLSLPPLLRGRWPKVEPQWVIQLPSIKEELSLSLAGSRSDMPTLDWHFIAQTAKKPKQRLKGAGTDSRIQLFPQVNSSMLEPRETYLSKAAALIKYSASPSTTTSVLERKYRTQQLSTSRDWIGRLFRRWKIRY